MWEERFEGFIGPYKIEFQDISDDFRKSIPRHECPGLDGASLEDKGFKARTVKIRCYFINEIYHTHKELLEYLKNPELLDFVHPKYGLLKGKVEILSVRHNERRKTAEVDITFIEGITPPEPEPLEDIEGKAEENFEQGISEQQGGLADDFQVEGIPERTLDDTKGILEQFSELTGTAREYVKTVDTAVSRMDATLNKISNPANSLVATMDFATDLPGRVIGSMARTTERYAEVYLSLTTAPSRFLQSFKNGMSELETALELNKDSGGSAIAQVNAQARADIRKHLKVMGAMTAALNLSYAFSSDEEARNSARRLEGIKSFDHEGNFIKTEATPDVLTVDEIEKALALAMGYIQEAVDDARAVEEARDMRSLKAQALSLVNHVEKIKIEREKIVTITVDNPTPLHIICHANGLPYNYAPRVLALNPQIKDPSTVEGEVKIYAG
jgi:prophage DNA circulation protein